MGNSGAIYAKTIIFFHFGTKYLGTFFWFFPEATQERICGPAPIAVNRAKNAMFGFLGFMLGMGVVLAAAKVQKKFSTTWGLKCVRFSQLKMPSSFA